MELFTTIPLRTSLFADSFRMKVILVQGSKLFRSISLLLPYVSYDYVFLIKEHFLETTPWNIPSNVPGSEENLVNVEPYAPSSM